MYLYTYLSKSENRNKNQQTDEIVYLQNKEENWVRRTKGMRERKSYSSESTFFVQI